MEDLKAMLDKRMPIADINQQIYQFIHSIDGHDNRLKIVFVLLYLLAETDKLIQTINPDDFIKDVRERMVELHKNAEQIGVKYHSHLMQNYAVTQLLTDSSNNRFETIQKQISTLLNEYDDMIKVLVEIREEMSVEQQISTEKNNGSNA